MAGRRVPSTLPDPDKERPMTQRRIALPLLALAALLTLSAFALRAEEKASIQILSPQDGAQLDAGEAYPLQYAVVPGPGGDHFHVWVDAERGPGVHDRKGIYQLPRMTPGEHTITLKVVDKGHVPTGPEKSIKVRVK
jgi:hypothetical protein